MVLKESLMKLLQEKQLSAITVKEICELADINRSTFYSHYSDQYDLLHKMEKELIEDMREKLNSHHDSRNDLMQTEKILEYIAEKKDIFQILLNDNGDTGFQKKVIDVAHQFLMKDLMIDQPPHENRIEYMSTFIISGSIHVIKSWLDNGMDKSQKEMAEMIYTFAMKGLSSIKSF